MELKLTIFLALTFLVLAGNTLLLWHFHRMLRRTCRHLDDNRIRYARLAASLKLSVRLAEARTTRLSGLSARVRSGADELGETLDRLDNWARYGLARLDFNADRASEGLGSGARELEGRLGEALYKTAAVVQGVRAVLDLATRSEGSWARRPIPPPVDTALVLVQALTALGELFSTRRRRAGRGAAS